MEHHIRKAHFIELGQFLRWATSEPQTPQPQWSIDFQALETAIAQSQIHNGWFVREQVVWALQQWGQALEASALHAWLEGYTVPAASAQKIGLVLAGNIPLVGFHDVLCVWLCGHHALIRPSSNDQQLLRFVYDFLCRRDAAWAQCTTWVEGKLENFDAVIATGSSNTARYFEYYFQHKPHIIRKNRNSVAVLTGRETAEQLAALGHDIFRYFGLGCRSVSKLWVPEGYDFDAFFQAIYPFHTVLELEKYANNYDYNKAVYLMSLHKLLENGFVMLKEEAAYASPIATLHYQTYTDLDQVHQQLQADAELWQCVVADVAWPEAQPFGSTQQPGLSDYADRVDTLAFLTAL